MVLVKTDELSVVVLMRIGRVDDDDVVVGGGSDSRRESGDGKESEEGELEDEGEEGLSSAESSDDEDYTSEEEGVGSGDDLPNLLLHSICFHDTPPPEPHSMSSQTPTPPPLSLNPKNCSRLATVSWRSHTSLGLVLWCLSACVTIPFEG